MEVTFRKAADRKSLAPWIATKGKTRIVGSILGCDPRDLGHDIVTLVVERELGVHDGFFGTVEAGGTFRSMGKRRHTAGKAAIARNRPGLADAERVVHEHWDAWLHGRPTPCAPALDRTRAAWLALPPGGTLTLEWPAPARATRRVSSRRAGR